MDTTAVHLTELTPENTEVVGVNGKVFGHCGYSLPIVKHVQTGLYCALSLTRKPSPAWSHETEIREMQETGRLTLFPESIKLPTGWTADKAQQPVVTWFSLFVGRVLLHHTKQRPFLPLGEDGPFVFCADRGEVEKWFSDLASRAQAVFDGWLASEPTPWAGLAEVAEAGLQAARDHGQRYWMYVRRCVALYFRPASPPELAYQLFRGAVEPTYKGVTWERFFEGMRLIYERAKYARHEARTDPSRTRTSIFFGPRPEDAWRVPIDIPSWGYLPDPGEVWLLQDEAIFKALCLRQRMTGEPMDELLKSWLQRFRSPSFK